MLREGQGESVSGHKEMAKRKEQGESVVRVPAIEDPTKYVDIRNGIKDR